jgi:hypothetical protein
MRTLRAVLSIGFRHSGESALPADVSRVEGGGEHIFSRSLRSGQLKPKRHFLCRFNAVFERLFAEREKIVVFWTTSSKNMPKPPLPNGFQLVNSVGRGKEWCSAPKVTNRMEGGTESTVRMTECLLPAQLSVLRPDSCSWLISFVSLFIRMCVKKPVNLNTCSESMSVVNCVCMRVCGPDESVRMFVCEFVSTCESVSSMVWVCQRRRQCYHLGHQMPYPYLTTRIHSWDNPNPRNVTERAKT